MNSQQHGQLCHAAYLYGFSHVFSCKLPFVVANVGLVEIFVEVPLVERNMRKEDLRLAAGLTTNMIANMGKGKNISMETLVRICEALNCGILDVIELEQDDISADTAEC